jgi:hypothetical protein
MIERVIEAIASDGYPSSGDSLARFATDAEHHLSKSGMLEDVDVDQTGEAKCLLAIRATVTGRARTLQDVSTALRQAWAALGYSDFQAASCTWYSDATVLRFVTGIASQRTFVTGEIVARGGPYEKLVETFEHDFGDVHGGLSPMPGKSA